MLMLFSRKLNKGAEASIINGIQNKYNTDELCIHRRYAVSQKRNGIPSFCIPSSEK